MSHNNNNDDNNNNICVVCEGKKIYLNHTCTFCNGTGEWNDTANVYLKNHICQCIFLDRKFCPVCHKKCHHDTILSPKQVIDSGYGGLGATTTATTTLKEEEEEIIA